jgi:hypothetical protein
MNPYTQKLLTAIAAYETKCGFDPSDSILEALWYDYSCQNPVDDGQIKAAEAKLSPVFAALSLENSDQLFDVIVELLNTHQRAAYLEGLRTGAHLIQELSEICP